MIPTGSMAPTLMGKHKDLECPMCHYCYQVSASDRQSRNNAEAEVPTQVYQSTCPMCRFTADLRPNNPQGEKYPSYDGDRILVAKFPYEFADPKPWDIIVFKYPGDATMNYIKRLVGLPGETISIHDGDLWIHQPGQPEGLLRSPASRRIKSWRCSSQSTTTIWRPRSPASCTGPPAGPPSPTIRGLTPSARSTDEDLPRSRSKTVSRARPGFATGIGCRRPISGTRLRPLSASRAWP